MSSVRCKQCGLANFPHENECARCGNWLSKPKKKDKPPKRFSLFSLVAFGVVAIIVYYAFGDFQKSMDEINKNEAQRLAVETKDNPNRLSKSEYERQRASQFSSAVKNSNNLSEVKKHNDETQKALSTSEGEPQK
jgi:predicted nucleic acid-binding Zn ribbon protein